jgi:formate-dependent nitrite reductase membrane component NrfD
MEGKIFVFWNWTVALYLFIAGVSAGAFAISAIAYFLGRNKYENISRLGAYISSLSSAVQTPLSDLRPGKAGLFLETHGHHPTFLDHVLGASLLLIFSFELSAFLYLAPENFDL